VGDHKVAEFCIALEPVVLLFLRASHAVGQKPGNVHGVSFRHVGGRP
jgi:hypothetical protein